MTVIVHLVSESARNLVQLWGFCRNLTLNLWWSSGIHKALNVPSWLMLECRKPSRHHETSCARSLRHSRWFLYRSRKARGSLLWMASPKAFSQGNGSLLVLHASSQLRMVVELRIDLRRRRRALWLQNDTSSPSQCSRIAGLRLPSWCFHASQIASLWVMPDRLWKTC